MGTSHQGPAGTPLLASGEMSESTTPPIPPAETAEEGTPIRSRSDRMYGPPRAAQLAFGAPQPLIAYAVPFTVVAIVASLIAMTALAGALSIGNGAIVPLRSSSGPGALVGAGALALVLVLGHAYAITATTLSLLARSDGRHLSARDAWVGALRRPGSVTLAAVISGALTVIAAGISTIVLPVLPLAGIAAALLLVAILIITAPLLLAWPQLVGGRKRLGAALGWAWRSTRMIVSPSAEPFHSPRVAIVSTVVLTGLVTAGLTALGGLLPIGWWTPVAGVALALVPTALAQVLLAGVLVRGVALREEDVAIAPLVSSDAASAPTVVTRRGGPLWGIALLLVPALLAGVLLWADPWRVPAYSAADVPQVWRSSQIVPWADGTAVLSRLGGESAGVRLCSGATCTPETDMRSIFPTAIAPDENGGILSASWYPIEGPDRTSGRFELRTTYSSPDALREWAKPLPRGLTEKEVDDILWDKQGMPGDERVLGGIDSVFRASDSVFARSNEGLMGVAIDTSGEFPVIASVARPRESINAVVSLDFCADAECAESTQTTIPVTWGYGGSNSTSIDVALAPDGRTAVVSLADGESKNGLIPLRVITATADGESTSVTLAAETSRSSSDDFDFAYGAQLEIGSDGLPVVLYRAKGDSKLWLLSCGDLSCGDSSITTIDPPSDVQSSPTLAIDSSGRPLIGVVDATASVALLSCDDAACTTQTPVRLVGAVPTELGDGEAFALSLDAEDRPLLAVGVQRVGSTKKSTWSGTVLECAAPRCGAP